MAAIPPAGTPVGLEVLVKDVARASAFYTNVFSWSFAPSTWGIPADKLLTFTVPGGVFPVGGVIRRTGMEDLPSASNIKLYFYVDDITSAMEAIEKNGGKKMSDVIPEEAKGLFQYFQDSEGNNQAIYTYVK